MTPLSEGNALESATKGYKPVLFTVQNNDNAASFMHARVVHRVDFPSVEEFCVHLSADAVVQSDAFTGSWVISKSYEHHPKVTPPEEVANWLPKVHVAISILKTILLETFHGVTHKYMQEYVDEFVYLFNHRWWEP